MLSMDKMLRYVKHNLGAPFFKLELSDEEIIEYIREFVISEFSRYVPDVKKIRLNLSTNPKVPDTENEFYLEEPDGLEILSIREVIFNASNLMITGHPIMGAFNQMDLRNMVLDVETSQMVNQYSMFNYTFEFKHPNIIRISPVTFSLEGVIVEYERVHPEDLSTIKNEYQTLFLELCLAEIMITLGRIRSKYSSGGASLKTPFGEIPLNGEILQEGQEKKRDIMDKLQSMSFPNVTCAFG